VSFDILAAIDLRGGKVVRLRQGDFAREDVYGDDPIAVGERFAEAGLRWLHVVDLDAARSGGAEHGDVIRGLLSRIGARIAVEVGGGIRDERTARKLMANGAKRVVMGTVAVTDPQLVGRIVGEHGADAVAVAIDVRAGRAFGRGWGADGAGPSLQGAIRSLAAVGVGTFEVTAIERDGSLEGPDLELLADAIGLGAGDIIASGGIRSIADIEAVKGLGCRGAIVGRAIYEGRIALEDLAGLATDESAREDATDPGSSVLTRATMNEPTA
jgi:phosphoribosylformimino-5-aminoimidazole carboxamide ribotide isomerase